MKIPLCFLMITFTSFSFADCVTSYNTGVKASMKAELFSSKAQDLFTEMKSQASNNYSDEEICTTGKEARINAFLAAKSFKTSRSNFLDAIEVCSAPNDAKAASFADKATAAYNTSATFVASMDNLLGSKCSEAPLTPLLNN